MLAASCKEFGRKCQMAVLHSLIDENLNNGDDIRECDWLEHLIRDPESAMKAFSADCRTFPDL